MSFTLFHRGRLLQVAIAALACCTVPACASEAPATDAQSEVSTVTEAVEQPAVPEEALRAPEPTSVQLSIADPSEAAVDDAKREAAEAAAQDPANVVGRYMDAADVAAVVRCAAIGTTTVRPDGRFETLVTFSEVARIKGEGTATSILFPGGVIDDVGQAASEVGMPSAGRTYLVFAKQRADGLRPFASWDVLNDSTVRVMGEGLSIPELRAIAQPSVEVQ